jgi:hypothetical protein
MPRSKSHAFAGQPFTSPSVKPKATPKPRVDLRSVACPDCPAKVDEDCRATTGKVLGSGHASRRRIATRRANEAREAEGTLDVRYQPPPPAPGSALDPEGEECPVCRNRVRVKADYVLVGHRDDGRRAGPRNDKCPGSEAPAYPPGLLVAEGAIAHSDEGLRLVVEDAAVGRIRRVPNRAVGLMLTLGEHDGFTEHRTLTEAFEVARLALGCREVFRRRHADLS